MKKIKKTKEQVIEQTEMEMSFVQINTLDGKVSLLSLIKNVGVKNRVRYFNNVEKRCGISFAPVKKIFNHGIIFNNGFEIKGVNSKYVNFTKAPIIEKRERVPDLKIMPKIIFE